MCGKIEAKPLISILPVPAEEAPVKQQAPKIQNNVKDDQSVFKKFDNSDISKVKSASIFSLGNMLRPKQHAAQEGEQRLKSREYFSLEQLELLWVRYADGARLRGHQGLYIAMKSAELELKEDNIWVEIAVDSNSKAKEIEDMVFDVFEFLKNELKNHYIRHSIVVKKTQKELLPYTQREIFDYLLAKNPKLSLISEKLNINIQ